MSQKQGNLSLDSGGEKKRRAPEQPVDNLAGMDVAMTKRWIYEHGQPVDIPAERKTEISKQLRALREKIARRK